MFRSLAAFIFGSNTEDTNCQRNNCSEIVKEQQIKIFSDKDSKTCSVEDKTTIEESQSIAVTTGGLPKVIRNKTRRNNKKNKSKRQEKFSNVNLNLDVLTSESHKELDSEENDWIFLENDGDINLNGNNNTTSTPTLEILSELQPKQETFPGNNISIDRRQRKNKSDQKNNHNSSLRHVSTSIRECDIEKKKEFSPLHSSSLNLRSNSSSKDKCNDSTRSMVLSECDVQQSLRRDMGRNVSVDSCDENGSSAKLFTMVDSWYMTPPSCFDSNEPIHMEIPWLENLLIEHPSMSIYRTIGSAQKGIESFAILNCEVDGKNPMDTNHVNIAQKKYGKENKNTQTVCEDRSTGPRIDRREAALLKMQIFALNSQKSLAVREHHNLRRSAILRSNQVREIQSRCNRQRRSDVQHCRLNSGANNNRKCC